MRIGELGEFGIIDRIARCLPGGDDSVIVGIGDDVAVLRTAADHYLLATCDIQVENVHFVQSATTPYQLGCKAIAINLSDIAAMGGQPSWALVSLALPPDTLVEFVDERRFVKVKAEKAKSLKEWLYYKDCLEADRFINIPVAKTHSEARLTLCLKNMMGAIGGWRGRCHVGLHQNIADMNLVLRPDLHVLDCTRILLKNGPSGGNVADTAVKNLIFAGTDPVALDAQGTTLFGLKASDISYIIRAQALGLGEMDLGKVKFI